MTVQVRNSSSIYTPILKSSGFAFSCSTTVIVREYSTSPGTWNIDIGGPAHRPKVWGKEQAGTAIYAGRGVSRADPSYVKADVSTPVLGSRDPSACFNKLWLVWHRYGTVHQRMSVPKQSLNFSSAGTVPLRRRPTFRSLLRLNNVAGHNQMIPIFCHLMSSGLRSLEELPISFTRSRISWLL